MKKMEWRSIILAVTILSIVTLTQSCKEDDLENNRNPEKNKIYKGPSVRIGNGRAYTWLKIKDDGSPEKLGIALTNGSLNNLPQDPNQHEDNIFVLQLPQKADLVFDHITIDWNPAGHPPLQLFDVPHFDFHFYTISLQERTNIPPYEVEPSKHDHLPPVDYLPEGYFRIPGGVPMMGVHWGDQTAPEFNGQPFIYSFLYGTYDGKQAFLEPMISYEFLEEGNLIEKDIKQPNKFSKPGYYPTKFKIYKEDEVYHITLEDFIFRE